MVTKSSMLINQQQNWSNWQWMCEEKAPSRRWSSVWTEPEACGRESESLRGTQALPHLPLVQWGYGYPLERLRSDTSTFRMFWIYRRRKKRGKRNGSEKDREETSIQGSQGTSLVQLVRTTRLSPAALCTPRAPSDRLWCQLHLPKQAAADYCSTLHTAPTPLSSYPSTTTSQLQSDCPENQRRGRWQMIWEKEWDTHILWRLLVISGGSRRSAAFFSFAFFLSSCSCSRAVLLLIFLQLWTEEESEVQTEYAYCNPKKPSKSNSTE